MNARSLLVLVGGITAGMAAWLFATEAPTEKAHKLTTISPRKFADSLHAVIAADREAYSRHVVERLAQAKPPVKASPEWRRDGGLPTHAQLLREAATRIQQRGAEFSYTLRGRWPLSPSGGAQTEIEQQGLEFVAANPDANFYSEETLGGRSYFTAIYADRATSAACVDCHNAHPASPRRDVKVGEVMGALVIRVPLEF
ncbi:MAG: DUF3365 domain-containing protein [Verrucomicrobia bacterium]|nr:DUF3365 domain-containing protein [Verrucomicrobiota bacterium]